MDEKQTKKQRELGMQDSCGQRAETRRLRRLQGQRGSDREKKNMRGTQRENQHIEKEGMGS